MDALVDKTTKEVMIFVRDQQGTTDRDNGTRCSEVAKANKSSYLRPVMMLVFSARRVCG